MLFKARSSAEAIARAEASARAYESEHTNPYGQRVRYEFTGSTDAFELFDGELSSDMEVFSSTRLIPKDTSPTQLDEVFFGAVRQRGNGTRRRKFLNADP